MKAIIFDWVGTLWKREDRLFDFTIDILRKLKENYVFGLVSKAGIGIGRRMGEIESSGIKDYFKSIIVEGRKSPEEFKKCASELGVIPEETLVVGDRASKDIGPAKKAGFKTAWISIGDRSDDSPNDETGYPDYIVESIRDLPKILGKE